MENISQGKLGYKFTEEFGYIPDDWALMKLESLGNFYKGAGISKDDIKDSGIPCIRYAEIYTLYNFVVKKCYSYIDQELTSTSVPIKYGDILLAGSGETKEEIGKCIACLINKAYAGGDNIIFRPYTETINSIYASYTLNTICRTQLNKLGQGDAIVHIHSDNLKEVLIPVPPLPEQEKIAEVLGDIDSLIDTTQKLINKKEDIKTATMQKLLTPKEDWVEKKLGEITPDIYQPQTISQSVLSSDGYPVYGANGIIGYYSKYNHITPQITVTCRGSTCGTINLTLPYSWITGNAMVINIDKVDFNKSFLYYLLSYADLSSLITGSGQPQIIRTSISEFKLFCPCNTKEQEKIAAILSDMDAEIETLEKELNKYKDLKIGMMQQLLTGKVRMI